MMHPSNNKKNPNSETSPSSQATLLDNTSTPQSISSVVDAESLATLSEQKNAIIDLYQRIDWTATNRVAQQPLIQALQDEMHKLKGGVSYLPFDELNLSCPQFYADISAVATAHRLPQTFHSHYQQMLLDLETAITTLSQAAPESLSTFLQQWDADYAATIKPYNIFQPEITAQWDSAQRKKFVRYFYHIRGHFFKFLWLLGNEAPDKTAKDKIVDNIVEEFGGDALSHERLYTIFACEVGVEDIQEEFLYETHHLANIKQYNQQHLIWLSNQNWLGKCAGFAAYEKLDNIDYAHLYALANSLGVPTEALAFFKIHNHANHFDRLHEVLNHIWHANPEVVKTAFDFIGQHQAKIWKWLSGALC